MTFTSFYDSNRYLVILQGIYDIIPVVLFLLGSVILLRLFYSKMVKGCYCLLAAGSIMVFNAGVLKAIHKICMGAFRIDYIILDKQFTPTQSIGFVLLFLAFIGMFTSKNKDHIQGSKFPIIALPALLVLADEIIKGDSGFPAFTSTLPFIVCMIIGASGFLIMLMVYTIKSKMKAAPILFGISILFMIAMGYLSTMRTFEGAWLQISCNICYQTCYFLGCLLLKKREVHSAKNA